LSSRKNTESTVEQVLDKVALKHETLVDPAVFLAELMTGFDPRRRSSDLFNIIKGCSNRGEKPDDAEWELIKEMVLYTDLYSISPVSMELSYKASKDLIEYKYAKKRAVNQIEDVSNKPQKVPPLTEEEVDNFEEWFLSRF